MTNELVYDIARQQAQARIFEYGHRHTIKDLSVCTRRDWSTFGGFSTIEETYDSHAFDILRHIDAALREALC